VETAGEVPISAGLPRSGPMPFTGCCVNTDTLKHTIYKGAGGWVDCWVAGPNPRTLCSVLIPPSGRSRLSWLKLKLKLMVQTQTCTQPQPHAETFPLIPPSHFQARLHFPCFGSGFTPLLPQARSSPQSIWTIIFNQGSPSRSRYRELPMLNRV